LRRLWRRCSAILSVVALLSLSLAFAFQIGVATEHAEHVQQQKSEHGAKPAQPKENKLQAFWKWTTHDPVAFYTSILAVFTFVLAVSTIGLWGVTWLTLRHARQDAARQSRDMQSSIKIGQNAAKAAAKSADAAERGVVATDRAWIEIDIDLAGDLIFGEQEISVPVKIAFKNVGRSPAVHVTTVMRLFPDSTSASYEIGEFIRQYRSEITGGTDYGFVLFPGRDDIFKGTLTLERATFLGRLKEIDDSEPEEEGDERISYTHSVPAILAYAQYRLPSEGRKGAYHFSTQIVDVCPKDENSPGFDGSSLKIDLTDIELIYSGFGVLNT
jgi:hypothetical protein